MNDPKALDKALANVRRALDRLTESGHSEPAFAIARAQFAASIRASWPANLTALANAIDHALAEAGTALSTEEQDELRDAASVFRSVRHA
ncbi:MAG TPA: hypothetical protein VEK07_00310 [Polyangiaceae bacterium]|nr:hypothetical protein [Polyangiaceae bacterium]